MLGSLRRAQALQHQPGIADAVTGAAESAGTSLLFPEPGKRAFIC